MIPIDPIQVKMLKKIRKCHITEAAEENFVSPKEWNCIHYV